MEKKIDYLGIIEELNKGLYDKFGENAIIEYLYSFTSNGYHCIIYLGEVELYNSMNDDREYDENIRDYEEILPYIKRKTNEFIHKINKYKF